MTKGLEKELEEIGIAIECFEEFKQAIDIAAGEVLSVLNNYDDRVAIPALVTAIVSVCKAISEETTAAPFDAMIDMAHQGIDAMKRDFIREGVGEQINLKGH